MLINFAGATNDAYHYTKPPPKHTCYKVAVCYCTVACHFVAACYIVACFADWSKRRDATFGIIERRATVKNVTANHATFKNVTVQCGCTLALAAAVK